MGDEAVRIMCKVNIKCVVSMTYLFSFVGHDFINLEGVTVK